MAGAFGISYSKLLTFSSESNLSNTDSDRGEWISYRSFGVGIPSNVKTLYNWFSVDEPRNKGFELYISASIHPNPHISIL